MGGTPHHIVRFSGVRYGTGILGTDMDVVPKVTEVPGTGIDVVPNLLKCPVPELMSY